MNTNHNDWTVLHVLFFAMALGTKTAGTIANMIDSKRNDPRSWTVAPETQDRPTQTDPAAQAQTDPSTTQTDPSTTQTETQTQDETPDDFWGDPIHTYTRAEAVEDGFQVTANEGDFAEVTQQHYKYPVYMSRAVFNLIEKAVNNKKHCNDYKGIWHDILHMSKVHYRPIGETARLFKVIIKGAARQSIFYMVIECMPHDIDDPSPCYYVRLYGETD